MWKILDAEKLSGTSLTESLAMNPAASVSGLYFANPKSFYFSVGKVTEDQVCSYYIKKTLFIFLFLIIQVIDYAKRKNYDKSVMEKWLSSGLAYETN